MSKASTVDIARAITGLSGSLSSEELSSAIASYLVIERRTIELDKIMREVKNLRQKSDGIVEVDVTSAYPISEQVKSQISTLIDEQNIVVNRIIDKSVIGGVRVETSNKSLDLTLRNRLNKLKARSK